MNCLLLFITFIIVFISTNGQFAPPPWMGPNSFGGPWGPRPWRKRPCNYFDQFIDQGPCRIPGWHRRFGGRPPPPDSNWGQNWQQPDQQMPDQQETSQNWPNQQQQPNQQQPNQQQPSQQQPNQQQPAATTTRRPGNRPGNGQDPLNILGTATQNAVQTTTTQPTTTQRPIITTVRPLGNRPSINNNDPLNILGNSVVTTTQRPIVTTRPPIVTKTQRATTRPAPVITTTQRATTRPAPVITTTQRQTQRPIVTTTLRIALGPNGKADPNSDAFIPPPPA